MIAGVEIPQCHVCIYAIPKKKKKEYDTLKQNRGKNCHFESFPDFSGKADSFLIENRLSQKNFQLKFCEQKCWFFFFPKGLLGKRRRCSLGTGCCIGTALVCFNMIFCCRWAFLPHAHTKIRWSAPLYTKWSTPYLYIGRNGLKQKWRELNVLFLC